MISPCHHICPRPHRLVLLLYVAHDIFKMSKNVLEFEITMFSIVFYIVSIMKILKLIMRYTAFKLLQNLMVCGSLLNKQYMMTLIDPRHDVRYRIINITIEILEKINNMSPVRDLSQRIQRNGLFAHIMTP
ncbi:hypothetical protein D3C75_997120 [compost metagenome]